MLLPEKVVPFLATLAWSHDEEATLMPLLMLVTLSVSQSVYEDSLLLEESDGEVGGVFGEAADTITGGERGEFKRAFDKDSDYEEMTKKNCICANSARYI